MGMAASQARLLSITARMHDVEYKSQNIMSQKVALATQKDDLYQEYDAALSATKIQVAFKGDNGSSTMVDATFESVCEYKPGRQKTYMMTDANTGKMIVSREMYEAYNNFKGASGGDKYGFALQMLGVSSEDMLTNDCTVLTLVGIHASGDDTKGLNDDIGYYGYNETSGEFIDSETGQKYTYVLMDQNETAVFNSHPEDDASRKTLNSLLKKLEDAKADGDRKEIRNTINKFRTELYAKYAEEIYAALKAHIEETPDSTSDLNEWDPTMLPELQYYAQIFEGIESCGGCIPVDEYNKDGDSGNEWFNNMVKSGRVILSEYNSTGTKKGTWSEVSVATSTNLQEVKDDTDLKKAEAKYQHELSVINKKETKFDQELNKLETERTALNKEMDSIKQVKDDNVERTFGIFS